MTAPNRCSPAWIDAFLRRRDPARTAAEASFVARNCPRDEFRHILDVPCGLGRHANVLAAMGYLVTGVDRDIDLISEAHLSGVPGASFVVGDMTRLGEVPGEFDAAICLWHSFGWLDDAGNAAVLRGIAGKLRPGGRFVLDVFHRIFFAKRSRSRELDVGGVHISEKRELSGNREVVTLAYSDGRAEDVFDWRLYLPEELIEIAAAESFECLLTCARFDERTPASESEPAMQLVFERRA